MILSIIVPAFNAAIYLSTLLKSLDAFVSRSDVELIFINDGSTDNTEELLNNFCEERNNTRLIKSENRGVSAARNIGIECSSAKYIWFVDADDEVNEKMASYLLNLLNQDFDFVWLKMKTIELDGNIIFSDYKLRQGSETISNWRNKFDGQGMLCQYVIRRDIIIKNNIRFVEWAKWFEDADFLFQVSSFSSNIYIEKNDWFYCYLKNPTSAMNSSKYEDRLVNSIRLSVHAIKRSFNYNIDSQIFVKGRSAISIAWCLRCLDDNMSKEMYNYCKDQNVFPLNLAGSWRQKLQILTLNHSFQLYRMLVKMI